MYYLQSRYYNAEWRRFINADGSVKANGDIVGFNMFAYCSNNPVMGYDPTGKWDWGVFWDAVVNVSASVVAAVTGTGATVVSMFTTEGDIVESVSNGFEVGKKTFGGINNAVNDIYYLFAEKELLENPNPQDGDISAYVNEGYIDRWSRLQHAKAATEEWYYSEIARDYYAEYSAHMYAWFLVGWADGTTVPIINDYAQQARLAEVIVGEPDGRSPQKEFIQIVKVLGI